jgi:hypothetical protein
VSFEGIGLKVQTMIDIYQALGTGIKCLGLGQWIFLTAFTPKRVVSIVFYLSKNKDYWPRMHS